MSKRPVQKNTLLNYFESPKAKKARVEFAEKPQKPGQCKSNVPKKITSQAGPSTASDSYLYKSQVRNTAVFDAQVDTTININSDSEDEIIKPKIQNRKQVVDSSESENESPKKFTRIKNISESDNENSPPNKLKQKSIPRKTTSNKSKYKEKIKDSLKEYSFTKGSPTVKQILDKSTSKKKHVSEIPRDIHSKWPHNTFDFLKPEKKRDVNGKKPDHPDYDSRTLQVPEDFLKRQTPAMRQWWELKSRHMDSVLFFKVGKFYELYHMDAVIGAIELGFSYMKGEFAHTGFPESAYAKMASCLIDKGHKVARVEQTETPEMMAERCKGRKVTKFDKVMNREICQVSTKATCIYTAQMPEALNGSPNYMYAIAMKLGVSGNPRFGICFVETTLKMFYLSEFEDDKHYSRFLALLAEYPAALILTERNGVSKKFLDHLNSYFKDIRKDKLLSKTQFYTAAGTLEELSAACYFRDQEGNLCWPNIFKKLSENYTPKPDYELALRSLGACLWYLKDSKLDIQVFSNAKFEWYDPLDLISDANRKSAKDYLILDSITINNLDLLGKVGTLQSLLDHCETAFGKRMLLRWICRPLCDVKKIKERQSAINELRNNPSLLKSARAVLTKMPDLERQLTKIHSYGNKFLAEDHPDGRAIFYEAVTYSKRKIKDFLRTLKALERSQQISGIFKDCESRLLRRITLFSPEGVNVDISDTLEFFRNAFDREQAEKDGTIIPQKGVVEEFDEIERTIENINEKLTDYLHKQSNFFGCKVNYFGTEKKHFQLDVPEKFTDKSTLEHRLEGIKRGAHPTRRFSTPFTRETLAEMMKAESVRAKILLDLNRKIFEKFSERHDQFDQVIQCLTILDVICSLAEYARTYSQDICIPDVLPFDDQPKIIIDTGRHPYSLNIDLVPNDIKMGVENYSGVIIITGPNMGGKSTLMRQVAITSIMAQIGSFVPAASCQLNLVDRVFTRLGGQDDIVHGQSTFYVELAEASAILQHASKHSLVLVDELGRGTSTHDGNAIATAYVKKITNIGCRSLFSTHYHSLVDHFIGRAETQLVHMACMVENEEDPTKESVTFLYKMAKGRCPKSYGFNVARLAGLNRTIIARGREFAKELEEEAKFRNAFQVIFTSKNISEIRQVLRSL